MKQTLLTFVLDESGSMSPVKAKTISGINEYVKSQIDPKLGPAYMTLVKFNSGGIRTVYENKLVEDVPELKDEDYTPALLTPLYDAMALAIRKTEALLATQNKVMTALSGTPADQPLVLIAVMTDGMENASQEVKQADITRLVTEKQAQGWNFAFLGCDVDAWKQAVNIGIPIGNAGIYCQATPDAGFARYAAGAQSLRSEYSSSCSGQSIKTSTFFGNEPLPVSQEEMTRLQEKIDLINQKKSHEK